MPLADVKKVDVAVIGGGVHGASAAYHLAKVGLEVALLEKESIGSGASGLSGGIIRCHYTNEPMIRLALRASQRWNHLEEELGQPCGYVRNGLIILVSDDDARIMENLVARQQRIGVDTELIDPAEVERYIPGFQTDGFTLGTFERQAGYADPYAAARAFAAKAQELGVHVLTGTEVTGIDLQGSRVQGVVTNRGRIECRWVVNCAGAWAPRIASMVGINLPIKPGALQMIAVNPRHPEWTRTSPTWLDLPHMTYCRPDAAGLMLAGGGVLENEAMTSETPDPDAPPPRPSTLFEAEMHDNILRRCPWAEGMQMVRSWSGIDGNTPDHHLIFGPVPGLEGYLQVAGGGGNSFKLSPATGEAVAEFVTTGKCSHLDLEAFSVTRFEERRTFQGAYRMHIVG